MAISEVAKNRKTDYKSNRPKPQKPQLLLASLAREMTPLELSAHLADLAQFTRFGEVLDQLMRLAV